MVATKKDNNKNIIKLLPHQLAPLKYLVSRCKNQHGLIINHTMGSGKSYLGAFFAKNYPNKKIIIVHPKGLENIWKDATEQLKVDKVILLTYDKLKELFRTQYKKLKELFNDSILIIDEAHNLLNIINNITPSTFNTDNEDESSKFDKNKGKAVKIKNKEKIKDEEKNILIKFLDIFKVSKKVLLLTGTPVINGLADIRWLINISAGKKVVPYNIYEFNAEYRSIDIVYSFFTGWVENIMFFNIFGINIINSKYRIAFSGIKYYETEINNMISYLAGGVILNNLNKLLLNNKENKKILVDVASDITKSASKVSLYKIDIIGFANRIYKNIVPVVTSNNANSHIISVLNLLVIGLLTRGLFLVSLSVRDYYSNNYAYDRLNISKMKEIGQYVSYYHYKDNDPNYPASKIKNESVVYTHGQLELWTRLIYNIRITDSEAVDLELSKNISEAELFKPTEMAPSVYTNKGRIIGNLTINNIVPNKFKKIAEHYKKNNLSTVVYSNFYEKGCLLFSKYLNHTLYTPFLSVKKRNKILQDFKDQKIKLLILHPIYFEGFSIKGTRVFHILEPLIEYYKKEQLYTRVVRYHSHQHLKLSERNVVIIQWGCTLRNIFNLVNKYKADLDDWIKNDLVIFYFSRYTEYDTSLSPDDILNNRINIDEKEMNTFEDTMKKISVDNSTIKETCCIYGDLLCKKLDKCYK
jgi:hypothetical protein